MSVGPKRKHLAPDVPIPRDLLIWMAGFFDGEGCVSIGKGTRKKDRQARKTFTSYALTLVIGQKDRASLELFETAFGGALYAHRRKGMLYYRWVLNSSAAREALVQLLPYLRVKREVAEVGIRFQEQMTAWNLEYRYGGYPEHIRDARAVFYEQAKKLNARNRPDVNAPAYEGPRAVAALRAVNEE